MVLREYLIIFPININKVVDDLDVTGFKVANELSIKS